VSTSNAGERLSKQQGLRWIRRMNYADVFSWTTYVEQLEKFSVRTLLALHVHPISKCKFNIGLRNLDYMVIGTVRREYLDRAFFWNP